MVAKTFQDAGEDWDPADWVAQSPAVPTYN